MDQNNASPSPSSPSAQYEFSQSENVIFTSLARTMRLMGKIALTLGCLMVVGFAVLMNAHQPGQGVVSLVLGLVVIVMGLWNRDVANPIEHIVGTQGQDISHLMDAMGKLKRIYSLQQTLLLAAILLSGLAFFIGLTGLKLG